MQKNAHKFSLGTKITACIDEYGSWGNGLWVTGKIVEAIFINGKPAYDVIDERGNIIHNISEVTIIKDKDGNV